MSDILYLRQQKMTTDVVKKTWWALAIYKLHPQPFLYA